MAGQRPTRSDYHEIAFVGLTLLVVSQQFGRTADELAVRRVTDQPLDLDGNRLEVARRFGATTVVNNSDGNAVETIMNLTGRRGVDTAIEAVGVPATFELCAKIIAPGGIIANVGVHGVKVDLHLESLWDRNISITTRLVDTVTIPMLFKTVRSRKIDPKLLITHRFKLDDILDAYETFANAAKTKALKVIIEA